MCAFATALIFASSQLFAATPADLKRFKKENELEATLASQILIGCTNAEQAREQVLTEMEQAADQAIARALELEREGWAYWQSMENSLVGKERDRVLGRQGYLRDLAVAMLDITAHTRIKQCIAARRIALNAPYPNACATNEGPLGCAGKFVGVYRSACTVSGGKTARDEGTGTLTVLPDGSVRLLLVTRDRSGGSDEIPGVMQPSGEVIVDQNFAASRARYHGRFTVKADPVRRLSGGGTYIYRSTNLNCDGDFNLREF